MNLITTGVHLKDPKTGKTTRVDIIDVPEDYTVEEYIQAYKNMGEIEFYERLKSGTVSFVRLPECSEYRLPLDIPKDGPQDIL